MKKYPFEVKGFNVNNDEELHELLEVDLITYEEYEEIQSQIDYETMEQEQRQKEYEEKFKGNKRTNWKKECARLNEVIYKQNEEIDKLKREIKELNWRYANRGM